MLGVRRQPSFKETKKTCVAHKTYYGITMPTVTFKVNADEVRRLRAMAKKRKLSLSDLIRQKTLSGDGAPGEVRRVRCRETGAWIFASAPGSTPLTTASVREILSDFP
jgi:hypothetical protein